MTSCATAERARRLLQHQRYPYEYLARDLGIVGTGEYLFGPVINIMGYDPTLCFGQHPATLHNLANGPVGDLTVNVYERSDDGTLRIDFNANPALYRAEDNAAHHRRFLGLLETLAGADPQQPIGRVGVLTSVERREVLDTWNDTAHPVPVGALPELFEQQVARTPQATALVFEDTELSYAQLNTRANRLAHVLIDAGVGPEQFVAVLMERSVELVVAILAIVKAGAVYVPLPVDYPPARMQQVIQETAAQVIVTDQATRRHGWTLEQSTCDIPVMVVDFNSLPTQERETNPDVVVDAQQLAYVMYTSGSTGAPKGVAITHRDVTSLAFDRVWQGGNQKKTLLHSPHAFDASTYELWVPLLNGHQIIMAPPGTLEIRTGKSDHSEESHQPLAHSGIVPPHG